VITLTVYFIYQRRVNIIQKQEREKTEFYKQIAESELKALRAQMNPHFMFNAINSIQSFVLKNDSKSAQFARLIRSVLENSKYETIALAKEIETLQLYIELECLRTSFSFDYDILVDEKIHVDKTQIPPMLLQPYIENAILHGLTPLTDRRGKLKVEFIFENSVLKCIIEDNGIGREKATEIKAKKRSSHQSMGMEVTGDRLSILNKNNMFKTNVLFIDKKNGEEAEGTRIEIYIEYIK
jgi:LytS/YehU family sensor histidine kinase